MSNSGYCVNCFLKTEINHALKEKMLKFPHYVLPFRGMTFKQVYDLYGSDAIAKQRQVVSGGIPAKYREFCKNQKTPVNSPK